MPFSEQLLIDWYWYTVSNLRMILPINHIEMDDAGMMYMGYAVPDGDKPVQMPDGRRVRQVMIYYNFQEVSNEWIH